MEHPDDSLFDDEARSAAEQAAAMAPPAAHGHFDELRGRAFDSDSIANYSELTGAWGQFFDYIGPEGFADLNHRTANLHRQIRDNGVTYNVYADAHGPQRPWSLDLFPLIITPESWQQIEAGVLQRVQLLDRVMADIYGPQTLLTQGLLPPALVQGHPGYLRAMHGVPPVGGNHLHVAAFDLARGADGLWWLVSQRTQAPSGLGYLLENRISISRLFPEAFEGLHVQRLASTYRALIEGLQQASPLGTAAHIALLTPGPYNETYFEHAYLARYLGLTLVEGSDLTVRDQRLYLRTLQGLEPVHGLLKRLDDEYLDPLELRSDSRLGVPGLLQAIRAGNVLVANAPGSAFLESTALLGFLPLLCDHLLGEPLKLPALSTWWCGERAALDDILPRLAEGVIKPTYPGSENHDAFESVLGRNLRQRQLDEWAGRMTRQGDEHTVQSYLPPSQMPTWVSHPQLPDSEPHIAPRSVILRVFAVADGPQSWRVLPGGLSRIVSADAGIASMQRGGSSADTWVQIDPGSGAAVDRSTLLQPHHSPATLAHRKRLVTSRAAENLFWLGRYTERAENTVRLARLTLQCLNGEEQSSPALLAWLGELAVRNTLVLPTVPSATQARRVFERSLIAGLDDASHLTSVGYNLRALKGAAAAIRERLSQEHWNVIVRAEASFSAQCRAHARAGDYPAVEALRVLDAASEHLAAMTGAQTDRMTRDDGWRLLSIGRNLERMGFLAASLARGFDTGSVLDAGGFEAMLDLFDSTITFHAQYQQSREVPAMLDLLVLDRDNPRALGWVAQTLRGRMAKLASGSAIALEALAQRVPDVGDRSLAELCACDADGTLPALTELLHQCTAAAFAVSDDISTTYFTHASDSRQSLSA